MIPLRLTDRNIHDATLQVTGDGSWEIRTTGSDPYVFTEPLPPAADVGRHHVLAFEYFSATGTNLVQVFLDPPVSEAHSVTGPGLSHSEGWSGYAIDLEPARALLTAPLHRLRLDLGSQASRTVRIRSLQLRPLTPQEIQLSARKAVLRAGEKRREASLRAYLDHAYPGEVNHVAVDDRQVRVGGIIPGSGPKDALFLAEFPVWTEVTAGPITSLPYFSPIHPDARRAFKTALERRVPETTGGFRDRLLSRWAVVRKTGSAYELLSHARYADSVRPRADLPKEEPCNKKGIGGLSAGRPLGDLDDLGISSATVNIVLSGLLSTTAAEGRTALTYGGQTWYADDRQVEQLDRTMLEAAKRHIVVSAIVLVGQSGSAPAGSFAHLIAHPDADPAGIFAMPNVSQEDGLRAYAAALDFLASRYSRPDGRYGRIHHWIMHNEINAGWVWTNAGEKSALLYMDLYQRSMRAAYLIARQYDPHARVFISLEHHWTAIPTAHIYAGRELLERLADFSHAEGDFDWAIAFHPYPQNLFDPRVWADTEPTFAFDTPKITFKNLEVLDAWVRRPRMLDRNGQPRIIHLTEQGLNSRDYSETALRDQAAGMAYAWHKFKDLDTIRVFDYHNWVDNRGEGGLRIGLRRFPDDKDDPMGRKPVWFVYQALGTDREEAVTAPYKSVVGVRDWAEVRHTAPIPVPPGR